ncbi:MULTISPECIES: hypothetical protein [unclassified Pseudomonas]|uniref:hypothetical protein n=1 Tax=unclassified Pseudomonas TaxID=196821 RepID=UPI0021698ABF|nr:MULTISPECIES: hypothetical protein [unclassified Pseudomonas]
MNVDDGGVFELGGEEVLLLAVPRGAEPLDLVSGELALGDMPLVFAVDADVRGCWHDKLLVAIK